MARFRVRAYDGTGLMLGEMTASSFETALFLVNNDMGFLPHVKRIDVDEWGTFILRRNL